MAEIPAPIIQPRLLSQLKKAVGAVDDAFDLLLCTRKSYERTFLTYQLRQSETILADLKLKATTAWFRSSHNTAIPSDLVDYVYKSSEDAHDALKNAKAAERAALKTFKDLSKHVVNELDAQYNTPSSTPSLPSEGMLAFFPSSCVARISWTIDYMLKFVLLLHYCVFYVLMYFSCKLSITPPIMYR
jgi:hypothetical protein